MRFADVPLYWNGWPDKWAKERQKRTEETGIQHEIDHIVPRNSPIVCGLENDFNKQVIPGFLNRLKSNKWWPTMTAAEVKEAIAFYKARGDI